MTRILVAYYSMTGHTAETTEAVAAALGADLERIEDAAPRTGLSKTLGAVWQALAKRTPPIKGPTRKPSEYDLVVLGCPVWASHMAAPMRTYIARQRGGMARLAVFCTEGGAGGEKVLRAMADLAGRPAEAALVVTEPDLKAGRMQAKAAEFAQTLAGAGRTGTQEATP